MINIMCYVIAYLIGGIPSGLMIVKRAIGVDIREEGSKSIGSTNVLRVVSIHRGVEFGKKLAFLTFAYDISKAVIPILIAKLFGIHESVLWSMGILAVISHCYSPYLKFNGGKGVATGAGVIAIFFPLAFLIGIVLWFLVAKFLKISVLASFAGIIGVIVGVYIFYGDYYTFKPLYIIIFIILYSHIPNIKRLFLGKEKKAV